MDTTPAAVLTAAADELRTLAAHPDVTLNPVVVARIADWLGCLAVLDPSERSGDRCGWCGGDHALAVARAVLGADR